MSAPEKTRTTHNVTHGFFSLVNQKEINKSNNSVAWYEMDYKVRLVKRGQYKENCTSQYKIELYSDLSPISTTKYEIGAVEP